MSQDTHFSTIRCENLRTRDVDLQIKLTKLHSETSSKQQLLIGEMLDLTITNMNLRTNSNKVYAFINVPTTKKLAQLICLVSEQYVMQNVSSPFIQHDNDLSVIKPNEPVRNTLMFGLKVKLIRARHVDEDVGDLKIILFVMGMVC